MDASRLASFRNNVQASLSNTGFLDKMTAMSDYEDLPPEVRFALERPRFLHHSGEHDDLGSLIPMHGEMVSPDYAREHLRYHHHMPPDEVTAREGLEDLDSVHHRDHARPARYISHGEHDRLNEYGDLPGEEDED